MSRHATFENFGMAFLTLFQVSTGDNWNGIMKVFTGQLRGDQIVSSPGCMVALLIHTQYPLHAQCPIVHRRGVRDQRYPGTSLQNFGGLARKAAVNAWETPHLFSDLPVALRGGVGHHRE
jgi:hypothetical protein